MTQHIQTSAHVIPGRFVKGDPPYVKACPADQEPHRQYYVQQWNSRYDKGIRSNYPDLYNAQVATQKLEPPTRGFACFGAPGDPPDDATFHAIIRGDGNATIVSRLLGCAPRMTRPAVRGWVNFFLQYLPVCKEPVSTLITLWRIEQAAPNTLLPCERDTLWAMKYTEQKTSTHDYVHLDNLLDGLECTQRGAPAATDFQVALVALLKEKKASHVSDAEGRLNQAMDLQNAGMPAFMKTARCLRKWLGDDAPQSLIDSIKRASENK